jgi:hypothetical protein
MCYTVSAVSLSRMASPEAEMLRIFGMPVNSSVNLLVGLLGRKQKSMKSDFAADR